MVMLKKKKKRAVKAPALFYPHKRNLKVKASRDGPFVFQWGDFVLQAVMILSV